MSVGRASRELRLHRIRHDDLGWLIEDSALAAIRSRTGWERLSTDVEFRLLQGGADRAVYAGWLRGCDAAVRVVAKSMRYPRLRQRLGHVLRPTRAAREWRYHVLAYRAGLPAVKPLALGERYRIGTPIASVLVTEYWDHDATLAGLARAPGGAPALPRLLHELGSAVRDMQRVGLFHHDLHPGNVLIRLTGEEPLRVVDWKHVLRSRWPRRRQAWSQLGKLAWQFESAAVFRADAPEREEAFYSGFAGQHAREVRRAVDSWLARTRSRLAERAARRCTQTNSSFARLEESEVVGFVRRGALPVSLRTPEALRSAAASGESVASGEPGVSILVRELATPPTGDPLRVWREANGAHVSHPLSPRPIAWIESRSSPRTAWLCSRIEDPPGTNAS